LEAVQGPWCAGRGELAENDSNVVMFPVRLHDAQPALLDALLDAIETNYETTLHAPEAMRFALEVARRAIVSAK